MRDAVNKAARIVINHCIINHIGTIVFGWNKGQKDGANIGKLNNQRFVSVPTGKLKDRIAQLCGQYGIHFQETEESYTSRASFVDSDDLPVFGAKPEGWKASGKRVKSLRHSPGGSLRAKSAASLYRTALNQYINADCNGASNIIRKVATTLGLSLEGVGSGALITPLRVRLWTFKNPPTLDKRANARLS